MKYIKHELVHNIPDKIGKIAINNTAGMPLYAITFAVHIQDEFDQENPNAHRDASIKTITNIGIDLLLLRTPYIGFTVKASEIVAHQADQPILEIKKSEEFCQEIYQEAKEKGAWFQMICTHDEIMDLREAQGMLTAISMIGHASLAIRDYTSQTIIDWFNESAASSNPITINLPAPSEVDLNQSQTRIGTLAISSILDMETLTHSDKNTGVVNQEITKPDPSQPSQPSEAQNESVSKPNPTTPSSVPPSAATPSTPRGYGYSTEPPKKILPVRPIFKVNPRGLYLGLSFINTTLGFNIDLGISYLFPIEKWLSSFDDFMERLAGGGSYQICDGEVTYYGETYHWKIKADGWKGGKRVDTFEVHHMYDTGRRHHDGTHRRKCDHEEEMRSKITFNHGSKTEVKRACKEAFSMVIMKIYSIDLTAFHAKFDSALKKNDFKSARTLHQNFFGKYANMPGLSSYSNAYKEAINTQESYKVIDSALATNDFLIANTACNGIHDSQKQNEERVRIAKLAFNAGNDTAASTICQSLPEGNIDRVDLEKKLVTLQRQLIEATQSSEVIGKTMSMNAHGLNENTALDHPLKLRSKQCSIDQTAPHKPITFQPSDVDEDPLTPQVNQLQTQFNDVNSAAELETIVASLEAILADNPEHTESKYLLTCCYIKQQNIQAIQALYDSIGLDIEGHLDHQKVAHLSDLNQYSSNYTRQQGYQMLTKVIKFAISDLLGYVDQIDNLSPAQRSILNICDILSHTASELTSNHFQMKADNFAKLVNLSYEGLEYSLTAEQLEIKSNLLKQVNKQIIIQITPHLLLDVFQKILAKVVQTYPHLDLVADIESHTRQALAIGTCVSSLNNFKNSFSDNITILKNAETFPEAMLSSLKLMGTMIETSVSLIYFGLGTFEFICDQYEKNVKGAKIDAELIERIRFTLSLVKANPAMIGATNQFTWLQRLKGSELLYNILSEHPWLKEAITPVLTGITEFAPNLFKNGLIAKLGTLVGCSSFKIALSGAPILLNLLIAKNLLGTGYDFHYLNKAYPDLNRTNQLMHKGDKLKAIESIKETIAKYPDLPTAQVLDLKKKQIYLLFLVSCEAPDFNENVAKAHLETLIKLGFNHKEEEYKITKETYFLEFITAQHQLNQLVKNQKYDAAFAKLETMKHNPLVIEQMTQLSKKPTKEQQQAVIDGRLILLINNGGKWALGYRTLSGKYHESTLDVNKHQTLIAQIQDKKFDDVLWDKLYKLIDAIKGSQPLYSLNHKKHFNKQYKEVEFLKLLNDHNFQDAKVRLNELEKLFSASPNEKQHFKQLQSEYQFQQKNFELNDLLTQHKWVEAIAPLKCLLDNPMVTNDSKAHLDKIHLQLQLKNPDAKASSLFDQAIQRLQSKTSSSVPFTQDDLIDLASLSEAHTRLSNQLTQKLQQSDPLIRAIAEQLAILGTFTIDADGQKHPAVITEIDALEILMGHDSEFVEYKKAQSEFYAIIEKLSLNHLDNQELFLEKLKTYLMQERFAETKSEIIKHLPDHDAPHPIPKPTSESNDSCNKELLAAQLDIRKSELIKSVNAIDFVARLTMELSRNHKSWVYPTANLVQDMYVALYQHLIKEIEQNGKSIETLAFMKTLTLQSLCSMREVGQVFLSDASNTLQLVSSFADVFALACETDSMSHFALNRMVSPIANIASFYVNLPTPNDRLSFSSSQQLTYKVNLVSMAAYTASWGLNLLEDAIPRNHPLINHRIYAGIKAISLIPSQSYSFQIMRWYQLTQHPFFKASLKRVVTAPYISTAAKWAIQRYVAESIIKQMISVVTTPFSVPWKALTVLSPVNPLYLLAAMEVVYTGNELYKYHKASNIDSAIKKIRSAINNNNAPECYAALAILEYYQDESLDAHSEYMYYQFEKEIQFDKTPILTFERIMDYLPSDRAKQSATDHRHKVFQQAMTVVESMPNNQYPYAKMLEQQLLYQLKKESPKTELNYLLSVIHLQFLGNLHQAHSFLQQLFLENTNHTQGYVIEQRQPNITFEPGVIYVNQVDKQLEYSLLDFVGQPQSGNITLPLFLSSTNLLNRETLRSFMPIILKATSTQGYTLDLKYLVQQEILNFNTNRQSMFFWEIVPLIVKKIIRQLMINLHPSPNTETETQYFSLESILRFSYHTISMTSEAMLLYFLINQNVIGSRIQFYNDKLTNEALLLRSQSINSLSVGLEHLEPVLAVRLISSVLDCLEDYVTPKSKTLHSALDLKTPSSRLRQGSQIAINTIQFGLDCFFWEMCRRNISEDIEKVGYPDALISASTYYFIFANLKLISRPLSFGNDVYYRLYKNQPSHYLISLYESMSHHMQHARVMNYVSTILTINHLMNRYPDATTLIPGAHAFINNTRLLLDDVLSPVMIYTAPWLAQLPSMPFFQSSLAFLTDHAAGLSYALGGSYFAWLGKAIYQTSYELLFAKQLAQQFDEAQSLLNEHNYTDALKYLDKIDKAKLTNATVKFVYTFLKMSALFYSNPEMTSIVYEEMSNIIRVYPSAHHGNPLYNRCLDLKLKSALHLLTKNEAKQATKDLVGYIFMIYHEADQLSSIMAENDIPMSILYKMHALSEFIRIGFQALSEQTEQTRHSDYSPEDIKKVITELDNLIQSPLTGILRDKLNEMKAITQLMLQLKSSSATEWSATENNLSKSPHLPTFARTGRCGTFAPCPRRRKKEGQLFGRGNANDALEQSETESASCSYDSLPDQDRSAYFAHGFFGKIISLKSEQRHLQKKQFTNRVDLISETQILQ